MGLKVLARVRSLAPPAACGYTPYYIMRGSEA